jgi:hypothetical protein
MQQKAAFEPAPTGRPRGPTEAPRCIGGPFPHEKKRIQGGFDSQNENEKNVEISNYAASPRQKTPDISSILKAHSNPPAISASKDGKLRQSTPGELTIEEAR